MPEEEVTDETKETKKENEETNEEEASEKKLTQEEVNKLIENARKQEKDKLYGKIEELSGQVTQLTAAQKAENEAKEKAEAEAKAKAETERTAKLSAEDRLAENMKRIEEQLAQESVERARLEQELRDERDARELEEYRQQVLSGEQEIIPDLVSGKSKADIDRSVARAKTRYQELFQVSREKVEGQSRKQEVGNQLPGPTDPNSPAIDEQELQKSVANFEIDPERYMKDRAYKREMDAKRNQMLDNVGAAYRRSVGR